MKTAKWLIPPGFILGLILVALLAACGGSAPPEDMEWMDEEHYEEAYDEHGQLIVFDFDTPTPPPPRVVQFQVSGSPSFTQVSAGWDHTCGLKQDGSIICWGSDGFHQAVPPQGEFASVSAGGSHTCGLKEDGSVACWGSMEGAQIRGLSAPGALQTAGADR